MEDKDETKAATGWSSLYSQSFTEDQQPDPLLELLKDSDGIEVQSKTKPPQNEEKTCSKSIWVSKTSSNGAKSEKDEGINIELLPIVSASDVPHEDKNVSLLLKAFRSRPQDEVLEVLRDTLMRHDIAVKDIRDNCGNTPLHLAAEKNYITIAETLLEHGIDMLEENEDGELALEVALTGWRLEFDRIASLIVQRLPKPSVRELISKSQSTSPRLPFHDLVKRNFEKTVAAVLDCMVEINDDGDTVVYYDILEADKKGHLPECTHGTHTNKRTYSAYHRIALQGSIDMVNHDTVRLLTSKKWNTFARKRFTTQALLYIMVVFAITFVAVTSVSCDDVMIYDTPLQHTRACFEVVAYICVCLKFLTEIRQLVREKIRYFADFINITELLASAVLICVLPVRLLKIQSHWYVFAVGYILWIHVMHKYAALFRTTGIQAQILWQILNTDVVQFSILFVVVNFAFSGCFLLVLKGDDGLQINSETSSFFAILLFGLRTLIEGNSVVDYTEDYRTMSIIVVMLFLFVTIVILLNILIAQLSDTYQRIAADADRNYEVNLARIIAWMEINDWSRPGCKTIQSKFYSQSELIQDIKERLEFRKGTLVQEISDLANVLVRKQNAHDLHVMTVKSEVKRMQGTVAAMKAGQPAIKRALESVSSEIDGIDVTLHELQKFPAMVKECFNGLHVEINEVKSSVERLLSELAEMRFGTMIPSSMDMEGPVLNIAPRPTNMIAAAQGIMLRENIPDLQDLYRDEVDAILGEGEGEWYSYLLNRPQHEVLAYLNDHYRQGKRVGDLVFDNGETALHIAAKRGHYFVVEKLIDVKVDLFVKTDDGKIAIRIALDNEKDDVAALLIRRIDKKDARGLFLSTYRNNEPMIRLADYFNENYSSFVKAVLDSLIDQDTVYYDALEADRNGHTPDQAEFDQSEDTVFQSLAKWGNKDAVNHIIVRVLIQRKWYGYARRQFVLYLILYLASLISLTFAVVKAAHADDVTQYSTPLDVERAVFEVLTIVFVSIGMAIEISKLSRNKLQYFRDTFNWLEGGSALILIVMIPTARFINVHVHWYIFAVGYFLWSLIIFKYAAIYRQSGAYAQILWHIVRKDIVQFSILFCVINLAFSGSFFLVVKGDGNLHINNETSTFFGIFFVGLRTMTEGGPVVTYIGPEGYRTTSVIVMMSFLFVTNVILLNILIAQLSDTYTKIQGDAKRELEVRMTKIIARIEQNPILPCCKKNGRVSSYVPNQPTKDLRATVGVCPDIVDEIYTNIEYVAAKQVTNQLNALALKGETSQCKFTVKDLKSRMVEQTNETAKVKHEVKNLGNNVIYLQSGLKETHGQVSKEVITVHSMIQEVASQVSKVHDVFQEYTKQNNNC